MADHAGEQESYVESVMDKITDEFKGHHDSSSSDSDNEKKDSKSPTTDVKSKIYRLFGRERPVHKVLGAGKLETGFPMLETGEWMENYYLFSKKEILEQHISLEPCRSTAFERRKKTQNILYSSTPAYAFCVYALFNAAVLVTKVFAADVFLWRDKKISAGVLGFATAVWVLFELLEYHLLTLICHILIIALAGLFLWSNASSFINKSPPQIPKVSLPEDIILEVASAIRTELNQAFAVLRDIASGRDVKQFLAVIAGLWVLSIMGSCCNFLTLFYISFVFLHTVPVLYEKYEDQVDALAEKAEAEIKKQYAVFDAKVLSKIPIAQLKQKLKLT